MKLRNVLGVALAAVTVGAGVMVANPGIVLAHSPTLHKTEARPCGLDAPWTGTVTASSNGDYNKVWQGRYKIGINGAWSVYSAYVDDQTPIGPIAFGPFAPSVSSVTVYMSLHWKNISNNQGQVTRERNITLNRPAATECPSNPTTGTWTATDGTCANPGGTLAVTTETGTTYSGSPAGTYVYGNSVSGSFAAQPGFVFQGNPGPFSHTFGVAGAPCQIPNNPQVQVLALCGSWRVTLTNIVDGVDPWETVPDATLTFTINGVPKTLVARLGETIIDGATVTEDSGDVTLVVNGVTYVARSDCDDNQIVPPVLTASYDCVSQTSSYTLTPASDPTWTAGAVTLDGNSYRVTITPNDGYTFGEGADPDGTITLVAPFQVTTDCAHTVAAPQVTPPTCSAPGSVVLPPSDFYTWQTNSDGTYTAVPNPGVRLVGTTTFGPFDLAQLTGEQCVVPTIDVAAFSPVCQADTPFIQYEVRVRGTTADKATLTFFDLDGNQVAQHVDVPLTGRVVYPGASENPQDWPGWKLNSNGLWVIDPTDARLRDGLSVTVEVNPTATARVSYPPETEACASPDQVDQQAPTTTVPSVQLPATGGSSSTAALIGSLLLLAGGALLLVVRRPRHS